MRALLAASVLAAGCTLVFDESRLRDGGARDAMRADDPVLAVSCGAYHSCAITTSGRAYCFGANATGAIGDGTIADEVRLPTEVMGGGVWTSISAGLNGPEAHTCGVAGGELRCWGAAGDGQAGIGTAEPVVALPTRADLDNTYSSASAGSVYSCGITTTGQLRCWGYDPMTGRLGLGPVGSVIGVPTRVGLESDWTSVAAGLTHTCGLRSQSLWCWGDNGTGQLGLGDTTGRDMPAMIPGVWDRVSVGAEHTCGIQAGRVWCWGNGADGRLGTEAPMEPSPVEVPIAGSFDEVCAGGLHSCAIADGVLWCWGSNADAQIGVGIRDAVTVPRSLDGSDWTAVACGPRHTCGIRAGTLRCWGANSGVPGEAWVLAPQLVELP